MPAARPRPAAERLYRALLWIALPPALLVSLFTAGAFAALLAGPHWSRWAVGFVALFLVPAVLLDRLLPRDDSPMPSLGVAGQVFACCWLAFPLLAFGPAIPWTEGLLRAEVARFSTGSLRPVAALAARMLPHAPPVTITPEAPRPSASAAARPSASATLMGAPAKSAEPSLLLRRDEGRPVPRWQAAAPTEILQDWSPRLVSVQSNAGQATGLLLTATGRVITARSSLKSLGGLRVILPLGHVVSSPSLVDEREDLDLMLLQLHGETPHLLPLPLPLTRAPKLQVSQPVLALRNPLALGPGFDRARWLVAEAGALQVFPTVTLPADPAMAGEIIVDEKGRLLGFGATPRATLRWPQRAVIPVDAVPVHWWGATP